MTFLCRNFVFFKMALNWLRRVATDMYGHSKSQIRTGNTADKSRRAHFCIARRD